MITSIIPPIEHTKDHYAFVHHTAKILPCVLCRQNYATHLHTVNQVYLNPDAKKMRSAGLGLNRAVFDIHNQANVALGRPMYEWRQFLLDMEFERRVFSLRFAENVMIFLSFVAHMHDHNEGGDRLDTGDCLEFLRLLSLCLLAAQKEADIGFMCLDIGTHGLEVVNVANAQYTHRNFQRPDFSKIVHQVFAPFVQDSLVLRPIPAQDMMGGASSPSSASRPHYNFHDPSMRVFLPLSHNRPLSQMLSVTQALFRNVQGAVEVADVRNAPF